MGKTWCGRHERFYETACEYCVAPVLPVVAAETVCTCDGCRLGRAARAMTEAGHALTSTEIRALEAMRKPHEKPRNPAVNELFASPPMVQDAPYDPTKAPIGKPFLTGETWRRMIELWDDFARRPNVGGPPPSLKLQICACGQCQVPEGETFVPKDSYDKHAHMRCEIFRRRPG